MDQKIQWLFFMQQFKSGIHIESKYNWLIKNLILELEKFPYYPTREAVEKLIIEKKSLNIFTFLFS